MLGDVRDAQRTVESQHDANHESDPAPVDLADIRLDLITDDRKVGERRIQDLMLELFVAFEDVAEHGDRDQEEREQAHESVVRDQRRKVAATVVAELLDDREAKSRRAVALLKPIDRANDRLDVRHAPH